MKAVFVEQTGGIDALKYGDFPTSQPGPGEVLVKIAYWASTLSIPITAAVCTSFPCPL